MDGIVLRKQKIIVESEIYLSPGEMDDIRNEIREQLKTGIVILPPHLKVKTVDCDQLIIKEYKE